MSRGAGGAPRAAIEEAWRRIAPLALYPRPLAVERVRILTVPWLFRLPWFRRFDGYTIWSTILLRGALSEVDADLIAHELVHVWQGQHAWVRLWLSYVRPSTVWGDGRGYWENPYEIEARRAVAQTRRRGAAPPAPPETEGVACVRPLLDTHPNNGKEQR